MGAAGNVMIYSTDSIIEGEIKNNNNEIVLLNLNYRISLFYPGALR